LTQKIRTLFSTEAGARPQEHEKVNWHRPTAPDHRFHGALANGKISSFNYKLCNARGNCAEELALLFQN
jgi:hypothetical protein